MWRGPGDARPWEEIQLKNRAPRVDPKPMPSTRFPVCITCGLDTGPDRPINRLQDGRVCPNCAERLLDQLPPPFPGFGHLVEPNPRSGKSTARPTAAVARQAKLTRRGGKQSRN